MIDSKSIEEVKEKADLVEVIKKYTGLKKRGANWTGPCPFHEEKTPSFVVSPAKGKYKCFGCGAGGNNAISFIMAKENFDFVPAVKMLANQFNVTLIETRDDDDNQEDQLKRVDYQNINKAAAKKYRENLMHMVNQLDGQHPIQNRIVFELMVNRQLTLDTIIEFQLGYAPDEWRYLTPILLERALFKPAEELGLVKQTNDKNFDIYRNRIMFPIHNTGGVIVGFGGRTMAAKQKKDEAKYLNSRESLIYKKDKVLYGLYQGAKAIRQMKFAVLVEGYFDVISFHQAGLPNTVASCGTALTEGHCKLLKNYTHHVIICRDGDEAGLKAAMKDIDLLLRHGFKVDICPMPEGHDPDSLARALMAGNEVTEKVDKPDQGEPEANDEAEEEIEEEDEQPF